MAQTYVPCSIIIIVQYAQSFCQQVHYVHVNSNMLLTGTKINFIILQTFSLPRQDFLWCQSNMRASSNARTTTWKNSTTSDDRNVPLLPSSWKAKPAMCHALTRLCRRWICFGFLGGVHRMFHGFWINSDSFGQQLLGICLVFHHLTLGKTL